MESIQGYLAEKTGYEGTLNECDKVCFSCYKSHLQILKHSKGNSVDTDLAEIIQVVKCNTMHLNSVDDAINKAMSMTTVHVGEAPSRQEGWAVEGLLLPDVHAFFLGEMKACVNIHTSEKQQVLTTR